MSMEISPPRVAAFGQTTEIPFCAHRHSPFNEKLAGNANGSATALTCAGVLAHCPLSAEEFLDSKKGRAVRI